MKKLLISLAVLAVLLAGCEPMPISLNDAQRRQKIEKELGTSEIFVFPNNTYMYLVRLKDGSVVFMELDGVGKSRGQFTVFPAVITPPPQVLEKPL